MRRRQFITLSLSLLSVGSGGALWLWLESGKPRGELTVAGALREIDRLLGKTLASSGKWSPAEIFAHCAQSVEYSMSGYPEHKSALFKRSVGSLAFSIFAKRGQMAHGLSDAIPGAAKLEPAADPRPALERLKNALSAFDRFSGTFAPHFAYGKLDRRSYELAHAMHLYNHLDEIQLSG